jgi:hypothetical protein
MGVAAAVFASLLSLQPHAQPLALQTIACAWLLAVVRLLPANIWYHEIAGRSCLRKRFILVRSLQCKVAPWV